MWRYRDCRRRGASRRRPGHVCCDQCSAVIVVVGATAHAAVAAALFLLFIGLVWVNSSLLNLNSCCRLSETTSTSF